MINFPSAGVTAEDFAKAFAALHFELSIGSRREKNTVLDERRKSALIVLREFCRKNDISFSLIKEKREEHRVDFIGASSDGRYFGIGYSLKNA